MTSRSSDSGRVVEALILAQLAREPLPGQVKTRMLPFLSAQQASDLHCRMVEHCCVQLCNSGLARVELWVSGDREAPLFQRCCELGATAVLAQSGGDLGRRMAMICRDTLQRADAVIMVGSDAPAIDPDYLGRAWLALQAADVVVGPALDGGYVLLGLRSDIPELFEDMPWGTDRVLAETEQRLRALGRDYRLLEAVPDIDRPEDLHLLPATLDWVHKP